MIDWEMHNFSTFSACFWLLVMQLVVDAAILKINLLIGLSMYILSTIVTIGNRPTNECFIQTSKSDIIHIQRQACKKCSACLGPSKVMGKIFCQICTRSTHHKHIAWSPYEQGSGQGHFDALWCNLHLYLNLFCVNNINFYFLVLNIFCGVTFFFSGTGGPTVLWTL